MKSLLSRILRYVARRGLRDAARLIPSESTRREMPERPDPLPVGTMRLHLFGANFECQADAEAFIQGTEATPSALTRELDGAFIDNAEVEVIYRDIEQRLQEFLNDADADDVMLRLAGDNTLILLTERAFGGFPYTLDDTLDLAYLGEITVTV